MNVGTLRATAVWLLAAFFLLAVHAFPQSWVQQVQHDIQAGRVREAIKLLKQTAHDHPNDTRAHFVLGNLLFQLRDLSGAEAEYKAILHYDSNNVEALNNLGVVNRERGNIREAIGYFQKAEGRQPSFVPPHENLESIYELVGNTDEAIKEQNEIVRLAPSGKATLVLARLYE